MFNQDNINLPGFCPQAKVSVTNLVNVFVTGVLQWIGEFGKQT